MFNINTKQLKLRNAGYNCYALEFTIFKGSSGKGFS